jgi:hypothetical protein
MLVDSKFENKLFDGMKNFERRNGVETCIKEKAKKESDEEGDDLIFGERGSKHPN